MPPKVVQVNGYILFVKEVVKPQLERQRGHYVSQPLAVEAGRARWEDLSAEAKDEWKAKAKEYRRTDEWKTEKQHKKQQYLVRRQNEIPLSFARRVGSVGGSSKKKNRKAALEAEEEEQKVLRYYDETDEEQFNAKREKDLSNLKVDFEWNAPPLRGTDTEERLTYLRQHSYCVLTAIDYMETPDHEFPPVELAALKLSMDEGIQEVLVWRLRHNFGDDPLGDDPDLLRQALEKEKNQQTGHGIPFRHQNEDICDQFNLLSDYDAVLNDLLEMTHGCKFIFLRSQNFNQVQGAVQWLKQNACQEFYRTTAQLAEDRFVCIEDLVKFLTQVANMDVDDEEIEHGLDPSVWSKFDFDPRVLCRIHKDLRRRNCAELAAKKIAYFLFDDLNDKLDFNVFPDRHIPTITEGQTQHRVVAIDESYYDGAVVGTSRSHATVSNEIASSSEWTPSVRENNVPIVGAVTAAVSSRRPPRGDLIDLRSTEDSASGITISSSSLSAAAAAKRTADNTMGFLSDSAPELVNNSGMADSDDDIDLEAELAAVYVREDTDFLDRNAPPPGYSPNDDPTGQHAPTFGGAGSAFTTMRGGLLSNGTAPTPTTMGKGRGLIAMTAMTDEQSNGFAMRNANNMMPMRPPSPPAEIGLPVPPPTDHVPSPIRQSVAARFKTPITQNASSRTTSNASAGAQPTATTSEPNKANTGSGLNPGSNTNAPHRPASVKPQVLPPSVLARRAARTASTVAADGGAAARPTPSQRGFGRGLSVDPRQLLRQDGDSILGNGQMKKM